MQVFSLFLWALFCGHKKPHCAALAENRANFAIQAVAAPFGYALSGLFLFSSKFVSGGAYRTLGQIL